MLHCVEGIPLEDLCVSMRTKHTTIESTLFKEEMTFSLTVDNSEDVDIFLYSVNDTYQTTLTCDDLQKAKSGYLWKVMENKSHTKDVKIEITSREARVEETPKVLVYVPTEWDGQVYLSPVQAELLPEGSLKIPDVNVVDIGESEILVLE